MQNEKARAKDDVSSAFYMSLSNVFEPLNLDASTRVILLEDFSDEEVNGENSTPIFLVSLQAKELWFAPVQLPQGLCLTCLRYWLRATESYRRRERLSLSLATVSDAHIGAGIAAGLIKEFQEGCSRFPHSLVTAVYSSNERVYHPVFRLGDCPVCAVYPPSEHSGLKDHCSSKSGLVQSMHSPAVSVGGVFHASASFISPPSLAPGVWKGLNFSFGRGVSRHQAQLGCLGEAAEVYCSLFRGDEPFHMSSFISCPGAIDPRTILCYSSSQYALRAIQDASQEGRHRIPETWDSSTLTRWVRATDLSQGEACWIPAACCYTRYRFDQDETRFAHGDTVGCASGQNRTHALVSSILELIERDATAIWWYNRIRRPGLRLESFHDPRLLDIQRSLKKLGRNLHLLDITTDLSIPCYVAVTSDLDGGRIGFGAAAHLSPSQTALLAITEAVQFWHSVGNGIAPEDYFIWGRTANLNALPFLVPNSMHDVIVPEFAVEPQEKLTHLLETLDRNSLRLIVKDLGRADIAVPVYRAFIPGLRHLGNRRGPGRLFEVPVKMGWLPRALNEEDLNPVCCVF